MDWNIPELILDKNFLQNTHIKSQTCVCCLAKDVQFVYLNTCAHSTLLRIILGDMLKDDELVCLGCHKVLQAFHEFKLQVEESKRLITQQIKILPKTNKLYNLRISNTDIYNTPCNPSKEEPYTIEPRNGTSKSENDTCKVEPRIEINSDENSCDNTLIADLIAAENLNINIKKELLEIKIDTETSKPINAGSTLMYNRRGRKRKHKRNKISHKLKEEDNKVLEGDKTDLLTSTKEEATTSIAQRLPAEHLGFPCEQCGRVFQWRCLLQRHAATAHVNCKLQCEHCAKAFKNKLALSRHIKSMHEKRNVINSSPVQCPICLNMFKLKKTLHVHLKKIHRPDTGKEEERYCVECNKLFKSKHYYDLHLKSSLKHAVDKYECHDCGKKFVLKGNLAEHIQRLHLKRLKHACSVCGKLFYKDYLRRLHEQHNHSGVPRERNHVCSLCGKAFTCSQVLKRHVVIHSGVKPYQCPHCPSRFTQNSTLATHCRFKHKELLHFTASTYNT